jgi:RNA polymerase sigma-70 factor (ECF subfamily)
MLEESVTQLLSRLKAGDEAASHRLLPLVYDQLQMIANRQLGGGAQGRTLTPTVLVHEAYLKLFENTALDINDRQHFFLLAAKAMRQVTVDHVRRQIAHKHGGHLKRVSYIEALRVAAPVDADTIGIDETLDELAAANERLARVVELRFFGGFSVEETAELLDVSPRTIKRDWRAARAFLYLRLQEQAHE